MSEEVSSRRSVQSETDADRAVRQLVPTMAKFQGRLESAIRDRSTGWVMVKVKVDRGRVAMIQTTLDETDDLKGESA